MVTFSADDFDFLNFNSIADLTTVDANTGALRCIPGSHRRELSKAVSKIPFQDATSPGDKTDPDGWAV
eukprot:SAG31_NODE_18804_length_622_cov_0.877629_1_plen_67_part_10